MNKKELYEKVYKEKGLEHQSRMLCEECCELAVSINHFFRKRVLLAEVCKEIADVEILIEQFKQNYSCKSQVELEKEKKIDRLRDRLKRGKL